MAPLKEILSLSITCLSAAMKKWLHTTVHPQAFFLPSLVLETRLEPTTHAMWGLSCKIRWPFTTGCFFSCEIYCRDVCTGNYQLIFHLAAVLPAFISSPDLFLNIFPSANTYPSAAEKWNNLQMSCFPRNCVNHKIKFPQDLFSVTFRWNLFSSPGPPFFFLALSCFLFDMSVWISSYTAVLYVEAYITRCEHMVNIITWWSSATLHLMFKSCPL